MARKQKQISAVIDPETHILLKKYAYGNVSRLIELMIQAHDKGRILTEDEIIKGELDDEEEENSKAA